MGIVLGTLRARDYMLTLKKQKKAAKAFAEKWAGVGDEKQDTQRFWFEL